MNNNNTTNKSLSLNIVTTIAKPFTYATKMQIGSESSEIMTTVTVKNPSLISNTNWEKNSKTHMDSYSQFKTYSINPSKILLYKFFIIFTIIAFVIYVTLKFLSIIKKT